MQAYKKQNLVCFAPYFPKNWKMRGRSIPNKTFTVCLKHTTLIKFFPNVPNLVRLVNRRKAAPTPPLARSILFPFDPLEVGRLPNQFFSPPLAYFVLLGRGPQFSLVVTSGSSFRSRSMTRSSEVQQRRPHRYLSVHKRFVERYSLSSNEQVRARRIRKATIRVATMIKFGGTYDAPTRQFFGHRC